MSSTVCWVFAEVALSTATTFSTISTQTSKLYLIVSGSAVRSVPSCFLCTDIQPCLTTTGEALESLLLRNDFVDAQVLSAIWPVEFDRYKVNTSVRIVIDFVITLRCVV
jgi:hypothetical protein